MEKSIRKIDISLLCLTTFGLLCVILQLFFIKQTIKKIGGYIIWTDLKTDKINITTLDYLIKGGIPKAINSFAILPSNQRYQGRIKNMNIESAFDAIRMVNNGIQQNVYYGFNYDTKKFFTTEDKITDVKNKRLSKKLPIHQKYKEDSKNKKYFCYEIFKNLSICSKNGNIVYNPCSYYSGEYATSNTIDIKVFIVLNKGIVSSLI